MGLLWCNVGVAEIIENKCSGYEGHGELASSFDGKWIEIIDTEKKTYKFKLHGKEWDSLNPTYMDTQKLKYTDSYGAIHIYNFINFKEELINQGEKADGYLQYDCINKKIVEEDENIEIASMIDKAKDTCKSLGFNEGTDKFSDCSLKLYSQSVELAAKNNQTVVMQPQSSGSNVMTIYDPVRDSQRLMDQGMKMITGRCTLGYDC